MAMMSMSLELYTIEPLTWQQIGPWWPELPVDKTRDYREDARNALRRLKEANNLQARPMTKEELEEFKKEWQKAMDAHTGWLQPLEPVKTSMRDRLPRVPSPYPFIPFEK